MPSSRGNVAWFVLDTNSNENDLNFTTQNTNTSNSPEATWLKDALATSTAQWKIVVSFNPVYSSGNSTNPPGPGSSPWMQWPFKEWGATAVISGHEHDYERLNVGGLPYFVDGLGGEDIQGFGAAVAGSQVRFGAGSPYNGVQPDFGALKVDATAAALTFQFVTRTGLVVDTYSIPAAPTPAAPTIFAATPASATQINLSWADNSGGASRFEIDRSTDGTSYTPIAITAVGATSYQDMPLQPGVHYFYRISALTNTAPAPSPFSKADATTLLLRNSTPTYLSDLPRASESETFGTAMNDLSIKGNPITLNDPITPNKVITYTKGLGTNSISQITYNLNGAYSLFVSDIGVDDEVKTGAGSVDFQVLADGKLVYDRGVMHSGSPTQTVDLDVTGVKTLTLIVGDAGDGNASDHGDWAGARLYDTTAPTTTATLSGPGQSGSTFDGAVSVGLTATDPGEPAATLTTTYSVDSAAAQRYTGVIQVSAPGAHMITFSSTDKAGNLEALKSVTFTINQPQITMSADPSTLWPANGKMVNVTVTGRIQGFGGNPNKPTFHVVDSYGSVQPSGTIDVGADGSYSFTIALKAERNGNDKGGRTYTIIVSDQDLSRHLVGQASTVVTVPHDQGNPSQVASPAVVQGSDLLVTPPADIQGSDLLVTPPADIQDTSVDAGSSKTKKQKGS